MDKPRVCMCVPILILILIGSKTVSAQDRGQTGLMLGYPASVGLMLHLTDQVGLRPEFAIAKSTTETSFTTPTTFTSSSDQWTVSVGLSALFYVSKRESLRTYVAPRFAYGRATGTASASSFGSTTTSETTSSNYSAAGLFGAQYSLSRTFGVFGEVGYGYSRLTQQGSPSPVKVTGNGWAIRSAVGAILYF